MALRVSWNPGEEQPPSASRASAAWQEPAPEKKKNQKRAKKPPRCQKLFLPLKNTTCLNFLGANTGYRSVKDENFPRAQGVLRGKRKVPYKLQ